MPERSRSVLESSELLEEPCVLFNVFMHGTISVIIHTIILRLVRVSNIAIFEVARCTMNARTIEQ